MQRETDHGRTRLWPMRHLKRWQEDSRTQQRGIKGNKVQVWLLRRGRFSQGAGSVDRPGSAVIPRGTGDTGSLTHPLAFLILYIIPCSDGWLKTPLHQARTIMLAYLQTKISFWGLSWLSSRGSSSPHI